MFWYGGHCYALREIDFDYRNSTIEWIANEVLEGCGVEDTYEEFLDRLREMGKD
jgi:hypothetical protein